MYKDMITKEIMQECIDQGMTQTEMAVRLALMRLQEANDGKRL